MPTDTSQIEAIRNQALTQIEQVRANPKPSYSVDGQRIDWQQYVDSLLRTVDWCDEKIAAASPYELRSRGGGE